VATVVLNGLSVGSSLAIGKAMAPAAEKGFQQARAAFVAGDYSRAKRLLSKAAAAGEVPAMVDLAYIYDRGLGVKADLPKAVHWYRAAADAGSSVAMYDLGICYQRGKGLMRNYKEAARWYQKAAAAGVPQAMYALGRLYFLGHGVARSYADSALWYKRAAKLGNGTAMLQLAQAYQLGWGVARDPRKASKWLQRATNERTFSSIGLPILRNGAYLLERGLGGEPCEVALSEEQAAGGAANLGLDVLSARGVVALSMCQVKGDARKPLKIILLAVAGANGADAPLVAVNAHWQLGGGIGPHSFEYNSRVYRLDKKRDVWVRVKKSAAKAK